MRRTRLGLLALAAAAAVAGCDLGSGDDESPPPDATPRLVDRLRSGGYVMAFRHAATDFSMTDRTRDLRDCSKQRNLSAAGRDQSRDIGRAFRRLEIPVGQVLASPYCRTRETARLAFGRANSSQTLLAARYFGTASADERQPRRLRRLLAERPRRGTNTVLVSHNFAIEDATGASLDEGEALIAQPGQGKRGYRIIGRVQAGDWTRFARSSSPPRVRLREYGLVVARYSARGRGPERSARRPLRLPAPAPA